MIPLIQKTLNLNCVKLSKLFSPITHFDSRSTLKLTKSDMESAYFTDNFHPYMNTNP